MTYPFWLDDEDEDTEGYLLFGEDYELSLDEFSLVWKVLGGIVFVGLVVFAIILFNVNK